MTDDRDAAVRLRAFDFLTDQRRRFGEASIPRVVFERGFGFEGVRVPMIGPQGIFKPAVLPDLPLTITTAPLVEHRERPYDDGFIRRRGQGTEPGGDYKIGCIILAEPTFFDRAGWIPQPRDWRPQTEVGRREDLTQGEGARIWAAIIDRLQGRRAAEAALEGTRYGSPQTVRPRLGQGAFRIVVSVKSTRTGAIITRSVDESFAHQGSRAHDPTRCCSVGIKGIASLVDDRDAVVPWATDPLGIGVDGYRA